MISLKNIVKKYGDIIALDNVSIDIPLGKITVILGPSGSGKTTLLRLIAGLESPDQGRIYISDIDVTELPPWDRGVSMVFQTPSLFPHLTVEENIGFGLEAFGYSSTEIKERIEWAMELLHISHLRGKYPDQLSGGEQQRVSLARALVLKPKILLLDEPLSNLDLALREELRIELKALQRRLGITFIYVTHDQDEALELADYLAILYSGKIIEYGDPLTIYERPREITSALVFGHNIVDVCIVDGEYVYPWDYTGISCNFKAKAIVPMHKITVSKDGDRCLVIDKLFRRNYGILVIKCGDYVLRIAVSFKELGVYDIGESVDIAIDKDLSIIR